MFYFLSTFAPGHCPVPAEGWTAAGEPFQLRRTLAEAEADTQVRGAAPGAGRVLVLSIDALAARGVLHDSPGGPTATAIPREAVVNVDPDGDLWAPVAVAAAGGVVVRRDEASNEPSVLAIFRRGFWDLPKGKLDPGEDLQACAVREVSEEVGVPLGSLTVTADLGETVHGYPLPRRGAYAVKTTRWYAMTTTAEAFEAQDDEGIEAVAWLRLGDAAERAGYESLRLFLRRLDADALGRPAPAAG